MKLNKAAGKRLFLLSLSLVLFSGVPSPLYPYAEKTHGKATEEAVLLLKKTDTAGLYREVYDMTNKQKMINNLTN